MDSLVEQNSSLWIKHVGGNSEFSRIGRDYLAGAHFTPIFTRELHCEEKQRYSLDTIRKV